ncbi:hypothetical protein DFH07DRAFT_52031 [Mycena maculata]|uniref:MYND-type domain-containing protein n=1 Tax=Mycena maculata TaxID=230809 RepID=A0AAD7IFD1_9AGAR|nr:hypothetical protein DFH07DRAFT_52031 [Mycena maculata]
MIWTKGRELELYRILSDAVTICRDPNLSPLDSELGRHDMAMADSTPDPPLLQLRANVKSRTDACYAAGCRRSFQEIGHAFRVCGGCGHVYYCSRECQVADWKDTELPHKVICKQLQIFIDAGGKIRGEEECLKSFNHALGDPVIPPLNAWFRARAARQEKEDLEAHLAIRGGELDGTLEEVE